MYIFPSWFGMSGLLLASKFRLSLAEKRVDSLGAVARRLEQHVEVVLETRTVVKSEVQRAAHRFLREAERERTALEKLLCESERRAIGAHRQPRREPPLDSRPARDRLGE